MRENREIRNPVERRSAFDLISISAMIEVSVCD